MHILHKLGSHKLGESKLFHQTHVDTENFFMTDIFGDKWTSKRLNFNSLFLLLPHHAGPSPFWNCK